MFRHFLALVILIGLFSTAFGQRQEVLYTGKAVPLNSSADEKKLEEALSDLMVEGKLSVDFPTGQFHWLVPEPIEREALEQYLLAYGITLTSLKDENAGMQEVKDPESGTD